MPFVSTDATLTAKRREGVVARRLGPSCVLVNLATNDIFELNETGGRIWELLEQNASVQDITERLVDEFDVDYDDCLRETAELLMQLQAQGLAEFSR